MPAYMHGNLAVDPKSKPDPREKPNETKKVVRRKTLPLQEKLLYLFTVVVCVAVAGVIIWRYAQIYEMNVNIQNIEAQISQLEAENRSLKRQVDELRDPGRLLDKAREYEMTGLGDPGLPNKAKDS